MNHGAAAFVVIALTVTALVGAPTFMAGTTHSLNGQVIWQTSPTGADCSATIPVQAVRYGWPVESHGCSSTWMVAVALPPAGSRVVADYYLREIDYFQGHRSTYSGIIFDDYQFGYVPPSTMAELAKTAGVCVVLYTYGAMPDSLPGACVIVAVPKEDVTVAQVMATLAPFQSIKGAAGVYPLEFSTGTPAYRGAVNDTGLQIVYWG